jgi:hypothetical protein
LNIRITYGKEEIDWSRGKVLERLSQGYSQHEVPTKLQARSTAIDRYHFIMDLCTNAGIISDQEVHGKKEEQLDALQKIDERERIEAIDEREREEE